ncbi:NACHT domain-containing protein [Kutzneria kofuensis]|uniref:NACHT domain-containing protein n=1 Tax=Kutzneria kofuensis TaxID=103725 RepID=UPI0031EAB4CC
MDPGDVSNVVAGDASGPVVQAGVIHGGVHFGPDTSRQAQIRLREYLQSLGQADDKHEYRSILDDGPPLGEIYLQRVAVRDGDRLPAERLLDVHDGLQVTGEPGAGKSSLLRRIAAIAARDLLGGGTPRFVPVLVTANDLAAAKSLREALIAGTFGKTDQVLDTAQLAELFREPPLPDVPWLVLVDGLDEVVSVGGQRDVLDLIRRSRELASYRFVVASRPIGSGGFRMMGEDRYPTYAILPFTDSDWIEFAAKWFDRYGHADARARATELLARVDRTKLGPLTRIPLTASMICLLHLSGPEQALPDNQSQLYAAFVRLLLSKFPQVDIRAQLRRTLDPYGAADAGERLVDHIEHLMEHLSFVAQTDGPAGTMAALTTCALHWPAAGFTARGARAGLARRPGQGHRRHRPGHRPCHRRRRLPASDHRRVPGGTARVPPDPRSRAPGRLPRLRPAVGLAVAGPERQGLPRRQLGRGRPRPGLGAPTAAAAVASTAQRRLRRGAGSSRHFRGRRFAGRDRVRAASDDRHRPDTADRVAARRGVAARTRHRRVAGGSHQAGEHAAVADRPLVRGHQLPGHRRLGRGDGAGARAHGR